MHLQNIDEFENYAITGGGGTDFDANWVFMKENEIQPQRFIMFTDGYLGIVGAIPIIVIQFLLYMVMIKLLHLEIMHTMIPQ